MEVLRVTVMQDTEGQYGAGGDQVSKCVDVKCLTHCRWKMVRGGKAVRKVRVSFLSR